MTTVGNLVRESVGFGVHIRSRNCATALPPPMCRLRRRHHLWRKYVPPNLLSRLYLLNACAQWVSQCPSSKPGKKNGLSSGDTPPRASSACRSRAASRSCSCPLRRSSDENARATSTSSTSTAAARSTSSTRRAAAPRVRTEAFFPGNFGLD